MGMPKRRQGSNRESPEELAFGRLNLTCQSRASVGTGIINPGSFGWSDLSGHFRPEHGQDAYHPGRSLDARGYSARLLRMADSGPASDQLPLLLCPFRRDAARLAIPLQPEFSLVTRDPNGTTGGDSLCR